MAQHRTWAEIYLDRAAHNFNSIRKQTGADVIAVIKADAYGHGAIPLARLYETLGARCFGVACVEEGVALREAGIRTPILLLGIVPEEDVREALAYNLTLAAYSTRFAKCVSEAAEELGIPAFLHIKVDTGMGRIGFSPDAVDEIIALKSLPGVALEGIFTHFAQGDEEPYTELQLARLNRLLKALEVGSVNLPVCHCANSAAVLHYKKAHGTYVRPGIILYGLEAEGSDLVPVMELKTRVCELRIVPAGETIGYGRTYTAPRETTVAVVPAGYADGVPRLLSNRASFLVHGKRAPIRGRVCMDMTMLDVTEIPDVQIGDEVTIFGKDLSADEQAKHAETISYELCCGVSKRVPRVYFPVNWDKPADDRIL